MVKHRKKLIISKQRTRFGAYGLFTEDRWSKGKWVRIIMTTKKLGLDEKTSLTDELFSVILLERVEQTYFSPSILHCNGELRVKSRSVLLFPEELQKTTHL